MVSKHRDQKMTEIYEETDKSTKIIVGVKQLYSNKDVKKKIIVGDSNTSYIEA